ncbi:hypothetical protein IPA_04935 [Ignicoccus pacificus DSM 13166]|uniref:Glycosidase n=1 Tax=Ignicoccus pacificus DSM 13166 TaxID=940294 RepID=A0A977KB89_9CREN|nr:hypothetical protein IPA_04935 [Ignicoccus pacificus DSM 13166]
MARMPLRSRIVDELTRKVSKAYEELRGLRRGKFVEGIFERVGYLTAQQIFISNYPRRPLVAFNPSAVIEDDHLHLFVRLVFDYYDYVSSIAYFDLPVSSIEDLPNLELEGRIVVYPTTQHEIKRGAEDPRAHLFDDEFLIFYTAVGLRDGGLWPKQGFTLLDKSTLETKKKGILYLGSSTDPTIKLLLPSWKNTIALWRKGKKLRILTRPFIEGHEVIWRATINAEDEWTVPYELMDVSMVHEDFEIKVGVSTPPVQISANEYLFGWHGIGEDLIYRNGVAIVNSEGELLGISEYLLWPSTIEELYGDRPMVIYGSGLVKRGDEIFWFGGVADYGIGIYRSTLDKLLETIKWIKG